MEKVIVSSKKRKRGEKIFRFENFCKYGQPILFTDSFQENIESLVSFGHLEDFVSEGIVQCWSFQLELQQCSTCVRLFVAEEVVAKSRYRQCHYCRSVGWGHHLICNKRFHFVLPSEGTKPDIETLSTELNGKGIKEKSTILGSNSKLKDAKGHYLMHGVIHSNGFGHLISINGIKGGSEFVSGHQILDLWDRICAALHVRQVSITDAAKKWSMELRLIHGLAYGQPWFSQWGYKFIHGSYGVTQQIYQPSLDALRTLPLFLFIHHFAPTAPEIPIIISKYQTLSTHNLLTISDIIHFMLELNKLLPPNPLTEILNYNGIVTEPTCRWSMKRVEMAAQVIVGALKRSEFRWVTRQQVRDAARVYIGDTGLLDYVLKSLGNHIVGNYIVRRMVNPITKVLEYCLQDVSNLFPNFDRLGSVRFQITRTQITKDLFYLYKHIIRAESNKVRVILDAKHLVKDYGGWLLQDSLENVTIMCTIRILGDHEKERLPPDEIVVLEPNATIGDLKSEVDKKFKELYLGLKSFTFNAVSIVGAPNANNTDLIVEVLELASNNKRAIVEGRINVENREDEIYEGCRDVDCHCGAKEDDGEKMVCCDICEIWQHTRCAGIGDEEEEVPSFFVCNSCESNIVALPSIQY